MDEEDGAAYVVTLFEQATTPDKRVAALQALQSYVDQADVLHEHVDELVNALRLQLRQANLLVASKALSVAPSFLSKLTATGGRAASAHDAFRQAHNLRSALQALVGLFAERLGDQRERSREGAKASLVQLAKAANFITLQQQQHGHAAMSSNRSSRMIDETPFAVFERLLTEAGLKSKVGKVREYSTFLLLALRDAIDRFPLKPFLPTLVDHLSDADANVREASRSTIIALFAPASSTAKAELKREMERKDVRKQTLDAILAQILGGGETEDALHDDAATTTNTKNLTVHSSSQITRASARSPALSHEEIGSGSSRSASRMGSSMVHAPDSSDIRAVYIASSGDLDRTFTAMLPDFVGKETEQNWQGREQSIVKIRGMLKTSTHEQFPGMFAQGIHRLADAILKAVASLRTTLSMHGLALISELAQQLGDDLESVAEVFLTALLRMAGFTKKIVANASQTAVQDILRNVSYKHKYLDMVTGYISEKNPTIRAAMGQHVSTLLATHGRHRKHALESHGGLTTISTFCKKALADANKDVRASARGVFYRIEEIWPTTARSMYESLDQNSQRQIETNRGTEIALFDALPVAKPSAAPTLHRRAVEKPEPAKQVAASPHKVATPGRASNALLAAKRAAAAAMAEERRREREREEAERQAEQDAWRAQVEAEAEAEAAAAEEEMQDDLMDTQEVNEEEMEEQRRLSPSPPPRIRSASRLSQRAPPSPTPSYNARSPPRRHTPSLPPSSIPLPVSPSTSAGSNGGAGGTMAKRPTSMLPTARSRTTSTSSASSARSAAAASRFGSSATAERYGSIAQRFDQQSPSQHAVMTREKRLSKVPTSSSPFVSTAANATPTRSSYVSPRAVLGAHNGDEEAEHGQEVNIDPHAFERSTRIASPSPLSHRAGHETDTTSPSLRSRLPRPVSMIASPASSVGGTRSAQKASSGSSETHSVHSSTSPAQIKDATTHVAQRSSSSTDSAKQIVTPTRPVQQKTQRDIVPSNAPAATKWFLGKANRLDNAYLAGEDDEDGTALSPVKRRPESQAYIEQLSSGRASLRTFKGLVALSKEFKLPARPATNDADNGEQGALGLMAEGHAEGEYDIAIAMWQEEQLFERLFDALCAYLRGGNENGSASVSSDLQTAALVLLHRLVEHQFGLFAAQGRECDLIELLFELTDRHTSAGSASSGIKSACQAIADRWADQADAIVGISTLRTLLTPTLAGLSDEVGGENGAAAAAVQEDASANLPSTISTFTLALRSLARLFVRLAAEVVEEQMEHCKSIVKFGLRHRHIELRQQAVGVLVAANKTLRDPQSLFGILQPIDKAQQDLLIYYMNKAT